VSGPEGEFEIHQYTAQQANDDICQDHGAALDTYTIPQPYKRARDNNADHADIKVANAFCLPRLPHLWYKRDTRKKRTQVTDQVSKGG
jgi:hypothetical protein